MARQSRALAEVAPGCLDPGSLRRRPWKRFLRGPDPALLDELYVPALAEAIRYDRCCAYFSSTVLSAAARGFGRLIERLETMGESAPRPAVRLVVNEELSEEDVRAMTEAGDLSGLERLLAKRLKSPRDILEKKRLAMLGWLVKRGLPEVRVGVMRRGEGIVHAKFGIVTDEAGDAVVFSGSGNESARGLLGNYERLEVSTSWDDPDRYREYAEEFAALWQDVHPDVHTVTLPEAIRLRLVRFAPKDPPILEPTTALARQRAAMIWRFIVEAPYLLNGGAACDATAMVDHWPHQRRVVEETAEAWPAGRLLCDEVGMGKTIEAILVLRRLMAGRGVRRALILLPAGLVKQWQGELREKGGMVLPRLDGTNTLVWPDGQSERASGFAEALERDVLLLSRETARTESNLPYLLTAEPWDLVVLDESHAARRKAQEEGEFNSGTLLLTLLRQLQLRRRARSILLLSATPMQTHAWEPWDLLAVLGEGGAWLVDFSAVRDFYAAIAAVQNGRPSIEAARKAALMVASDPGFPPPPEGLEHELDADRIARLLTFVKPTPRDDVARWLRRGSPLARRMHRNTRSTLRRYREMGLLPAPPPRRLVQDIVFDFDGHAEREVYNSVAEYIEKRFTELERDRPGKGFAMTIYRRRATSSPLALERSLERRRGGLRRVGEQRAYDSDLAISDVPEALDMDDLPEEESGLKVSAALPQDPQVARNELREVERVIEQLRALPGRDTKRDRFFEVLRQTTDDGRAVLVFTEYVDTQEYLRDSLVGHHDKVLGCYNGDGGLRWDGAAWIPATKDAITTALRDGELRVLICTDAASEGLNLQAAGAIVNFDLPWNPSRVEQRIGRVDRIGQRFPGVRVVNLFLKDSVDDKVYRSLRARCGLFEQFVGPMQPVLARARRMLLGQEPVNLDVLESTAASVEQDPLAAESYIESPPESTDPRNPPVGRSEVVAALGYLAGEFGFQASAKPGASAYTVSGHGFPREVFAATVSALERDRTLSPLSPLNPRLRALAEALGRPGERLPLVIASHQSGAFRSSSAYWVGKDETARVETFEELERRVKAWGGWYPDPDKWLAAESEAREAAAERVGLLDRRAAERENEGLRQQTSAARLRLLRELGRYLVCLGAGTADLNGLLHEQMNRDISSAQRLRKSLERLGGYPEWPDHLSRELEVFGQRITENQRRARLLGKELDAALDDPRWLASLQ